MTIRQSFDRLQIKVKVAIVSDALAIDTKLAET